MSPRPEVYRVGRHFGMGRKQHAFDLAYRTDRPVIENIDPDFGPSEQERDAIIAALSRSYAYKTGGRVGDKMVTVVRESDPRTRQGFDVAIYNLPPPFLRMNG